MSNLYDILVTLVEDGLTLLQRGYWMRCRDQRNSWTWILDDSFGDGNLLRLILRRALLFFEAEVEVCKVLCEVDIIRRRVWVCSSRSSLSLLTAVGRFLVSYCVDAWTFLCQFLLCSWSILLSFLRLSNLRLLFLLAFLLYAVKGPCCVGVNVAGAALLPSLKLPRFQLTPLIVTVAGVSLEWLLVSPKILRHNGAQGQRLHISFKSFYLGCLRGCACFLLPRLALMHSTLL